MSESLGYIMLVVENMDNSVNFYKSLLEKDPTFKSPRWSQFNLGDVLIGLHAADSWSDPNDPLKSFGSGQKGISFGLNVTNMSEYMSKLEEKTIEIVHGPRMTGLGNTIYIKDPDGYFIQICEVKQ